MSETPAALAKLLAETGWKPEHFARRLNRFAQHHGRSDRVHEKTPYKWQAGDRPRDPWPTLIAAVLSEKLQRVITPNDLGWSDDGTELLPARAGLILPWTTAGGLRAAHVIADAGPMYRRMFLTVLGATLTAPALEWIIAQPAEDAARTTGRALSTDVIDHLDSITDSLRRMDDHLGGGQTIGLLRQHLVVVVNLIENRRYTDTIGRRLHGCAGEILRLAGWLAFDAGHHADAQRYWFAALQEAHAAGERALGANILGFMSCQAKDIGQIRESVNLAEAARRGYPGGSPRVAAILDLRAAEAHANDNDAAACRRAIDSAFNRFTDPATSTGDPAWSYWMTQAQAEAQAGYCYLTLKDWARAHTHLQQAITLQGDESRREGALRTTLLATTYARQDQPDIDRAASLGTQAAIALNGQVTSARCVRHVRRLAETLTPYRRDHDVRQFLNLTTDLLRIDVPGAKQG